ncbi:hypothetical protein GCM10025787_08480 [Saccharopolyspora rosea]
MVASHRLVGVLASKVAGRAPGGQADAPQRDARGQRGRWDAAECPSSDLLPEGAWRAASQPAPPRNDLEDGDLN